MRIYYKMSNIIKNDSETSIPASDYYFIYNNGQRESLEDVIKKAEESNAKNKLKILN